MIYPSFFSSLIFGGISAYVARKRGKNPVFWFFIGVLFGIFGLLLLYFGDKVMPQRKKAPKDPSTIDITPKLDPLYQNVFWYYLDKGRQQHGPMSFDALFRAHRQGHVSADSYVWNEKLEGWQTFGQFL